MKVSLSLGVTSLLALSSLLTVAGCGDDSNHGGSGGSGNASASSSTGTPPGSGGATSSSTGTGGTEPECEEGPVVEATPTAVVMQSVEASVVDLAGAPAANTPAQVCGLDICIVGITDKDGHVVVDVAGKRLTNPAFKYGDGFKFAKFALALSQPTLMLGAMTTAKLPAQGAALTPGADAVSGDVTLTLASDTVVVIDDLEYDEPAEQLFRSATIPLDKAPSAVPAALGLEMLFGAGPIATRFCPAAKVTVPNKPGWPAGADVEFYVHGVDGFQYWVPYAGWEKLSDGKVSADGATVTTVDGGGLPIVSTFGVALKK